MIFAVGDINADWLIQDFIQMAADQNEKHEKNSDKEFKHSDGWGIAYLENGGLKIFRSAKAVYEDEQIDQFRNLKTDLVILHARKASKGNVDIRNVHPFECLYNGSRYLFFHNGTIHDELPFENTFRPISATDSEQLFYYLLSNSNGQLAPSFLKSRLEKLKDFTAANFILSNGETTFAGNWYSDNPNYYSLKLLQKPGLVMVASEVLPHFKTDDWHRLENREIVLVGTNETDFRGL